MSKKYDVHDEYGRRIGTLEVSNNGSGGILILFFLTIGFAIAPILLGGWLLFIDKAKQPKNLKFWWMASCFLSLLVLPIFGSGANILFVTYLVMGPIALFVWGQEKWRTSDTAGRVRVVIISVLALLWTCMILSIPVASYLAERGIIDL